MNVVEGKVDAAGLTRRWIQYLRFLFLDLIDVAADVGFLLLEVNLMILRWWMAWISPLILTPDFVRGSSRLRCTLGTVLSSGTERGPCFERKASTFCDTTESEVVSKPDKRNFNRTKSEVVSKPDIKPIHRTESEFVSKPEIEPIHGTESEFDPKPDITPIDAAESEVVSKPDIQSFHGKAKDNDITLAASPSVAQRILMYDKEQLNELKGLAAQRILMCDKKLLDELNGLAAKRNLMYNTKQLIELKVSNAEVRSPISNRIVELEHLNPNAKEFVPGKSVLNGPSSTLVADARWGTKSMMKMLTGSPTEAKEYFPISTLSTSKSAPHLGRAMNNCDDRMQWTQAKEYVPPSPLNCSESGAILESDRWKVNWEERPLAKEYVPAWPLNSSQSGATSERDRRKVNWEERAQSWTDGELTSNQHRTLPQTHLMKKVRGSPSADDNDIGEPQKGNGEPTGKILDDEDANSRPGNALTSPFRNKSAAPILRTRSTGRLDRYQHDIVSISNSAAQKTPWSVSSKAINTSPFSPQKAVKPIYLPPHVISTAYPNGKSYAERVSR